MIIRETDTHFICIRQTDHAQVSAEIAIAWKRSLLPAENRLQQAINAIKHHDDSWVVPDSHPLWDDAAGKPMGFIEYPLALRMHFYRYGLDQLENDDAYAALLCSLHYSSFFREAPVEEARQFYTDETMRQQRLYRSLSIEHDDCLLRYHFHWLQFCDDASLFLCLHAPATPPEQYLPAFRNGFRQGAVLSPQTPLIEPVWKNERTLELRNSPLQEKVSVLLPYKMVGKQAVAASGFHKAWQAAQWGHMTVDIW